MVTYLVKLALAKILGGDALKKMIITALAKEAAKSETTIDDDAVKVFSEIWDVVVPAVLGQMK
jgi:hypothetical protein